MKRPITIISAMVIVIFFLVAMLKMNTDHMASTPVAPTPAAPTPADSVGRTFHANLHKIY